MKSKVYYGEYSLMHWVNMMLSQEITLPDYQRSFVWKEKDIKRLLKSFSENQFVQPVTIALYPGTSEIGRQNLILDGQQRLTTILLAYLGFIPDLSQFAKDDTLATGDDSAEDGSTKAVKWTFKLLFDSDNSNNCVEKIRNRLLGDPKYLPLSVEGLEYEGERESAIVNYLKNKFLGFSYIVPDTQNESDIHNGYTRLFRNINYFGKKLTPLASRRSLYYADRDYKNYFEGLADLVPAESILGGILIKEKMDYNTIDFVRYLSTLSQYAIAHDKTQILKGYSAYSSRESYFADYVSYILHLDQEDREQKFNGFVFDAVFPDQCWKSRYAKLKEYVAQMRHQWGLEPKEDKWAFTSWIDADYWLYGLIYQIVFEGKELNQDINQLYIDIQSAISIKKDPVTGYPKTPNMVTNLRERIEHSINLYSGYVH